MPKMIYIAKQATKVRAEDGSYRSVARGSYFPEAEKFRNPGNWAILVSVGSNEGKLALESFEKETSGNTSSLPDTKVEGDGEIIKSEQNEEESNENQDESDSPEIAQSKEGETVEEEELETEDSEDETEAEAEAEADNQESTEDDMFKGMDAKAVRDLAKKNFNTKINGRFGLEKCITAYKMLEKSSKEEG